VPGSAAAGRAVRGDRVDAARLLHAELSDLRREVEAEGEERLAAWQPLLHRRSYWLSARNLACYLALRRRDLRELQLALMPLGLSSLGRCESRVLANLDAVLASLASLADEEAPTHPKPSRFFRGTRLLGRHADEVFGASPTARQVRIMVTLGAEACEYELVRELIASGMDVARINCAHDSAEIWRRLAANVRRAAVEIDRPCRLLMDLCGPRARTASVAEEGVRVGVGGRLFLADSRELTAEAMPAVGCSLPEALSNLEPGHTVWIDEGSVGAVVEALREGGAVLRVTQAPRKGARLRPDKGLNFPDTELPAEPLTSKDLADLDVACEEADIVGYSFVRTPEDVGRLQAELVARGRGKLALTLKIETRAAVDKPA
jgi:pyruvate kinase